MGKIWTRAEISFFIDIFVVMKSVEIFYNIINKAGTVDDVFVSFVFK